MTSPEPSGTKSGPTDQAVQRVLRRPELEWIMRSSENRSRGFVALAIGGAAPLLGVTIPVAGAAIAGWGIAAAAFPVSAFFFYRAKDDDKARA